MRPDTFTLVRLFPAKDEIAVQVQGLEEVKPLAVLRFSQAASGLNLLAKIKSAIARIDTDLAPLRPAGPVTLGKVTASEYRYFALRDRLNHVRDLVREWEERLDEDRRAVVPKPTYLHGERPRGGMYSVARQISYVTPRHVLREVVAALNIDEYLRDLCANAVAPPDDLDVTAMVRQVALLNVMAESVANPTANQVIVLIRGLDAGNAKWSAWLKYLLIATFKDDLGLESIGIEYDDPLLIAVGQFFVVSGPHALSTLEYESGTHLVTPAHENVVPLQVLLLPLNEGEDLESPVRRWSDQRTAWLRDVEEGRANLESDPIPLGPVVRIYHTTDVRQSFRAIDLRTGLVAARSESTDGLVDFVLAALPLPSELE